MHTAVKDPSLIEVVAQLYELFVFAIIQLLRQSQDLDHNMFDASSALTTLRAKFIMHCRRDTSFPLRCAFFMT